MGMYPFNPSIMVSIYHKESVSASFLLWDCKYIQVYAGSSGKNNPAQGMKSADE
jgi:hypothetical protein